ncbi:MAG: hypothetical protein JWO73_197 [Candidatus Taylorbacteria bacterium]|nr:hypothetical protein [Candidatus Taylorbacteria bacterium]
MQKDNRIIKIAALSIVILIALGFICATTFFRAEPVVVQPVPAASHIMTLEERSDTLKHLSETTTAPPLSEDERLRILESLSGSGSGKVGSKK